MIGPHPGVDHIYCGHQLPSFGRLVVCMYLKYDVSIFEVAFAWWGVLLTVDLTGSQTFRISAIRLVTVLDISSHNLLHDQKGYSQFIGSSIYGHWNGIKQPIWNECFMTLTFFQFIRMDLNYLYFCIFLELNLF